VVLLHFYLKSMFFKPLERVLEKRYQATEGARKAAEKSLEQAATKIAEYEAAMRSARAEVYQSLDRLYRRLQEEQATQLQQAHQRNEELIKQAKAQLAEDVERAKSALGHESEMLAGEIVETLLRRSAA